MRPTFAAFACILAVAAPALAEDFTYQGSLAESGSPATGTYDLTFNYFTAASGGVSTQSAARDDITVTDGVFQVSLPEPTNQAARYLEIAVRDGASVGPYTTLTPRTYIAAAPIATRALNVEWARNPANYLAFGQGTDVALINRQNRITANEYFGIGADVSGGFVGMYVSTTGAAGLPFYGYSAGGDIDAYHFFDGNDSKWKLIVGQSAALTIDTAGNTQVGGTVTAPGFAYQTPHTSYLSISGNTFTNGGNDTFLGFSNVGAGTFPNTPQSSSWFLAPVNLPHGAVITGFTGYLYDNSSSGSIALQFIRQSLDGSGAINAVVASVSTGALNNSATTRTLNATSISLPNVDNANYAYFLFAFFTSSDGTGTDLRNAAARIQYTTTGPD